LCVVAAGALVAWRARRDPAPLVAAAAYAVLLAPVLGLVQCGPHEAADRYSYLPSIPLALLAGGALQRGFTAASLRVRLASGAAVARGRPPPPGAAAPPRRRPGWARPALG